ncbi:unnamed protein product [Echinostoma caproni]|uniref:Uncharacterized protein n=1 Tax=Echinostoma caproni TaxID=27848 RepID=A0A183B1G9_9TREM|nr:unnamed protein product [Echinostoma caproni]
MAPTFVGAQLSTTVAPPLASRLILGDQTVAPEVRDPSGDQWRLHSARTGPDARRAAYVPDTTAMQAVPIRPLPTTDTLQLPSETSPVRSRHNIQRPRDLGLTKPTSAVQLLTELGTERQPTTATKQTKWSKLRKLGLKATDTAADKDRWGSAIEHIKRRHISTFDRKRLLAMAVLGPKETECLIETLQSLRESIELSNARLELELRETEPFSTLRMRRQTYHGHAEITTHRIPVPSGRASRSRGTRFDYARRSGGHRRPDEFGQNRDEKVSN